MVNESMGTVDRLAMMLANFISPPGLLASGLILPDSVKPSRWSATVGGKRLELEATGYAIELRDSPRGFPYVLVDPEGRSAAMTSELQALKELGERWAKDRAEFGS